MGMANKYSNYQNLFICTLLFLFSTTALLTQAKTSFRPKALVVPVTKDASTLQYLTKINQRTPQVPVKLVVDLGGNFLWVDCDTNYTSSTYRPARCKSTQCSLAKSIGCGTCFSSPKPGCNNNTCSLLPGNTVTEHSTIGEVAQDTLSIQSTNGLTPGRIATVSNFLFTCGSTFLLKGLKKGVSGMAGLGRTKIALPSQFSSAFSFHRKFAICLSSSTGVVFFGDGPYVLLPNVDASKGLSFTPLLTNSVSTSSAEYFIGVKSIVIDGKTVTVKSSLLAIDNNSVGGTKISTVNPYTVLEDSIFKAVTKAFINASVARNIKRVAAVKPFKVCFSGKGVGSTRLGAAVPTVEFVMQNGVTWYVFGANSVVDVHNDGSVLCLGFVNGGKNARTSIVIGGYQLENNLVQFDLAASRLGFSSLLYGRQTTCANFNFTSTV
ncbi:probable aspartic proteinase GIP2 [Lotus japonicus]|uniref:probable aspartic proteinase GIP2 n=1 Tax=Lotus japonicus TaxID=34305 RepID=UPI00258546B3|nr:probable aspartic proteinase GIP2 [Lotus japonicus]